MNQIKIVNFFKSLRKAKNITQQEAKKQYLDGKMEFRSDKELLKSVF